MKIYTIVGNRPQFVKAAAVSREMARHKESFQEILIHTGQHYDSNMSEIFFREMEIPEPAYNLRIGGCSHGAMTGRMLEKLEELFLKDRPDWVLVYGDTNSTLAGALAAVKLHIPVAHVESGLRSFNRKMPEEINRIVTDQCSDLLFTPTKNATQQLLREGFPKSRIVEVGDVMYDAFLHYKSKVKSKSRGDFVLATIHREENTDERSRLEEIVHGLVGISQQIDVVFPLHPRTKKALQEYGLYAIADKALQLIDPVGYFEMIQLESTAQMILTDSGGVQKEAYFCGVPCITLRDQTEWIELEQIGANKVVPPNREEILRHYVEWKPDRSIFDQPIYGDGSAASSILEEIRCKESHSEGR